MIDRDLAELYQVPVKRLNEQVKRNINRFPENFRFQLNKKETDKLVANCDRFNSLKHSSVNPYVFTEQGVAMLSTVLRSETAVKMSIEIMKAFVAMRYFLNENAQVFKRLYALEVNQLQTNRKIEVVLDALEAGTILPKQGIFFDGQIFDAYSFISDLIRSADDSIIIIDNYVDDSVLTHLTNKKNGVKVVIYTKNIPRSLSLAIKKFNAQYPSLEVKRFARSHDRFIIIDGTTVYHLGASLKDLGKKWFGFSKMKMGAANMLTELGSGK